MSWRRDPNASVAWLPPPLGADGLAGAAFLVGPELAITCAHVVRDHLGLGLKTPEDRPTAILKLVFAALPSEATAKFPREATAKVAPCGWFPTWERDQPSDIAILQLDEPVEEVPVAGPAIAIPAVRVSCYTFGCAGEAAKLYADYGLQVFLNFRPQINARGFHQLDPERDGTIGYVVKKGYSGAPVFDELGNVVLAMIVRADEAQRTAFAIPAEMLREALKAVRRCALKAVKPPPHVAERLPGPVDALANAAMAEVRVRAAAAAKLCGITQPPIDDLRGAFRTLAERGRAADQTETVRRALEAVQQGATRAAEDLLAAFPVERATDNLFAADVYRQVGAIVFLRSAADALPAYGRAAELDPTDGRTRTIVKRLQEHAHSVAIAEARTHRVEEPKSRFVERPMYLSGFHPVKVTEEFTKMLGQYKLPGIDMDSLVASQKKNVEALVVANRIAIEGMQAVAKRQAEIMQESMNVASKAVDSLSKAGSLPEVAATQIAADAFQKALNNMRELAQMVAKANQEATNTINARISASLDEVKEMALKIKSLA